MREEYFVITPKNEEERLRDALLSIATLNAADYNAHSELQWAEAALFRKVRQFAHETLDPSRTITAKELS